MCRCRHSDTLCRCVSSICPTRGPFFITVLSACSLATVAQLTTYPAVVCSTASCCSALCLETASLPATTRPHEVIIRALVALALALATQRTDVHLHRTGSWLRPTDSEHLIFEDVPVGRTRIAQQKTLFSRHLHQVVAARCPPSWWLTDCSYREPSRSESANRASTSPARFRFNKPSNCPATLGFIEGS